MTLTPPPPPPPAPPSPRAARVPGRVTPVVIDTDPGIDDAIAIALAVASPELDIRAVTSVGGNTGLANTTENALRLLHLFGRDDVPVAAGADVPLVRRDSAADTRTHGDDGLGGVHLPPAVRTADPRGAVALLLETLQRSSEPLTVIALGPLTNITALLAAHPAAAERIERIVVMGGGARDLGNMTPTAEFNIWFDPEAAARVFAAGLPLTMVGLDVTHLARTRAGDWALLRASGGPIARALLPMIDFYAAYHLEVDATDATAQHDALAVAVVIDPGLVTTQRLHVDVECVGPLTRGMTVVDIDRRGGGQPATDVALEVDSEAFNRLLVTRVAELDSRSA